MSDKLEGSEPVGLDETSLETWGLQGSGYSVRLEGEVDDTWGGSFDLTQHTRTRSTRFYLDRKRRVLVFSTEPGEEAQKILAEARTLVELTNAQTGRVPKVAAPVPPTADEALPPSAPETPAAPGAPRRMSHEATRLRDTRGAPRVEAGLMVQFFVGDIAAPGSASTGMTRDISENGLFVVTNRLPGVGERLSLRIHGGTQKRTDLTGEVARVLDHDEARRLRLRPGFGARATGESSKRSMRFLVRDQG